MSYFKTILNKIFPEEQKGNVVLLQEVLRRDADYLSSFEEWRLTGASAFIKGVEKGYQKKVLAQENDEFEVHLLSSKYANGFAISYNKNLCSKTEFSFAFDWMAEKVKELDYRLVTSDKTLSKKGDLLETKEKHYLKPAISKNDTLINQRFGNILIEHILVDDEPSYIKLVANVYSDSNYKAPEKFESFLEKLFK